MRRAERREEGDQAIHKGPVTHFTIPHQKEGRGAPQVWPITSLHKEEGEKEAIKRTRPALPLTLRRREKRGRGEFHQPCLPAKEGGEGGKGQMPERGEDLCCFFFRKRKGKKRGCQVSRSRDARERGGRERGRSL